MLRMSQRLCFDTFQATSLTKRAFFKDYFISEMISWSLKFSDVQILDSKQALLIEFIYFFNYSKQFWGFPTQLVFRPRINQTESLKSGRKSKTVDL